MAPMLDELEPLGLHGIAVLPGPPRRPLGVRGRLLTPRDFRGREIGEQQSSVAIATLRSLGAQVVRQEESARDGVETSLTSLQAGRYDIAGSHLSTNVNLWPRPLVVFASAAAFADLSAKERGVLRAAAASAAPRLIEQNRRNDAETVGNLCRRGLVAFDAASAADLRALRAAVEPVYRELRQDPAGRAALDAIAALKREHREPPATLSACRDESAPSEPAKTRLDGTWQMDTGRSAVLHLGLRHVLGLSRHRDAQPGDGRDLTRELQREAVAAARRSGAREAQPALPAADAGAAVSAAFTLGS